MTINVHDVTLRAETVYIWTATGGSSLGGTCVSCQPYQTRMEKEKRKT
jgi:UDP-N-acetyl-D-mannosaminuronate dehydrogenase